MAKPSAKTTRPALRLVSPLKPEPAPAPVSFCSHCGTRPAAALVRAGASRVCTECGFGLLLQAPADVAPNADDAFLVLDQSLAVCAVSRAAEGLLAANEPDVVNRHITSLLMPADAEHVSGESLAAAVAWAARGDGGTRSVKVRPANTFGIRLTARIAACGPPRAALLVLD
jgi:hypothetical protein